MKHVIAFAASVAVNFAALGALGWSVWQAQTPPEGEVFVTQLPSNADVAALASMAADSRGEAML
ncbi:MAG TPA: hypothetical protein VHK24_08595 [Steroidobacter sp.]|jgi:hypothetical protein|nr:hypothetical protein [Steroidobacter sp.]